MKCDSWQGLVTWYNRHDHVVLSALIQLYKWVPVDLISLGLCLSWIIYNFLRHALTYSRFGEAYVRVCEVRYLTCLQLFFLMVCLKSALLDESQNLQWDRCLNSRQNILNRNDYILLITVIGSFCGTVGGRYFSHQMSLQPDRFSLRHTGGAQSPWHPVEQMELTLGNWNVETLVVSL